MTPTRVLIVDDVADVRKELALVLSLSGDILVLGAAADGLEAIRQAGVLQPEVILMDLEMPGIDGCEAARRIKMHQPDCRVIALTIHDTETSREQCAQAGMDGFITKGASLAALLQAIRSHGECEEGETR
ncbi:MAG: response regulator transcription factor [Bacteroidota bacterium]